MRSLIDEIFVLENFNNQKLAKYLRCLFHLMMPLDDGMSLQLVDQAIRVAQEGAQVSHSVTDVGM